MLRNIDPDENQDKILRRLDSLSKLFEGANTCAAVASTSSALFITSNNTNKTQLDHMELVRSFLRDVSNGGIDLSSLYVSGKSDTPIKIVKEYFKSNERYALRILKNECGIDDKILDIIIHDVLNKESLKPKAPASKKLKPSRKSVFNYEPSEEVAEIINEQGKDLSKILDVINKGMGYISSSLRKVLASLLEHSVPKESMEMLEWVEQVRKNKIIIIENKKIPHGGFLHAEMALMQHLIDNDLLEKSVYIGISKLCCLNCIASIKALNKHYEESKDNIKITVRGAHYKNYEDNWIKPDFIDQLNIKMHYDRFLGELGDESKQVLTGIASGSDTETLDHSMLEVVALNSLMCLGDATPEQG